MEDNLSWFIFSFSLSLAFSHSDILPDAHAMPKRTILNYHCLTLYFISKWFHYFAASEQLQIHRAHSWPQTNWNQRWGALVSPLSSFLGLLFSSIAAHGLFLYLSKRRNEVSRASMWNKIFFHTKPNLDYDSCHLIAWSFHLATTCARITVQAPKGKVRHGVMKSKTGHHEVFVYLCTLETRQLFTFK